MEQKEDQELARAIRRVSSALLGIVFGVIVGFIIFVATLWLVIKGGPVVGPHMSLLAQFFPGYSVTWGGSVIGLAYGLLSGFVFGGLVGWIYNTLLNLRDRGE